MCPGWMGSFHSDKELHSNPSTLSTSFWVTLGKTVSVAQVSSLVTEAVSKPSPRTPWLLQTAWPLSDSPHHAAAELYLLSRLSFLGISLYKGIVMFSDSEKTMMENVRQAFSQPQPTNERSHLQSQQTRKDQVKGKGENPISRKSSHN